MYGRGSTSKWEVDTLQDRTRTVNRFLDQTWIIARRTYGL